MGGGRPRRRRINYPVQVYVEGERKSNAVDVEGRNCKGKRPSGTWLSTRLHHLDEPSIYGRQRVKDSRSIPSGGRRTLSHIRTRLDCATDQVVPPPPNDGSSALWFRRLVRVDGCKGIRPSSTDFEFFVYGHPRPPGH